jgi:hypothetical protein
LLRKEGKLTAIAETWNSFTLRRRDLFGFSDLVAIDLERRSIWAIQCTTAVNVAILPPKICGQCREAALA